MNITNELISNVVKIGNESRHIYEYTQILKGLDFIKHEKAVKNIIKRIILHHKKIKEIEITHMR